MTETPEDWEADYERLSTLLSAYTGALIEHEMAWRKGPSPDTRAAENAAQVALLEAFIDVAKRASGGANQAQVPE